MIFLDIIASQNLIFFKLRKDDFIKEKWVIDVIWLYIFYLIQSHICQNDKVF